MDKEVVDQATVVTHRLRPDSGTTSLNVVVIEGGMSPYSDSRKRARLSDRRA